jgi:tRNA-specific 2-thiouridylase
VVTGVGLFSGGLDSILAVKVLQDQGCRVIGVTFATPFFGPVKAIQVAGQLDMDHRVVDITADHLQVVRHPKHGYGRNMNPCIDCHALMFRKAGRLMEDEEADFLFSGEVLGERPMSQNRGSLVRVARESGYEDLILRPLSARLLGMTRPEREGQVDRSRLLDLSGRGRKRQMELAEHYSVTEYPAPAGGCLLTDPIFSRRLRDLLERHDPVSREDLELLKHGRHLRLGPRCKLIVGRNQEDNRQIQALQTGRHLLLEVREHPSPLGLLPAEAPEEMVRLAASVVLRYSDAPRDQIWTVEVNGGGRSREIQARACPPELTEELMI